ncbi:MAG: amidohydrolase [Lachnospiraceae bacterium]
MLLIKNANLLSMAGIEYEVCDVLVSDGKISGIGSFDVGSYEGATVIDAGGKLVTPGLVDGHCHVGLYQDGALWAGADGNELTDPIVPHMRGIDAVKPQDEAFGEALNTGITTVVTGPGSGEVIAGTFTALKTYGKTVYDMLIEEEVAMKIALGENPKRCFGNKDKMPCSRMGTAAILREALTKAQKYREELKRAQEEDKDEPKYDAKLHSLMRVFEGMPVKIHAHQQDDIVTALRIMDEFGLHGTIDHCTEGYLIPEVLAKKEQNIIIGPTIGERSKYELLNKSFKGGKVYQEHGITFALMTDHPVIPLQHTLAQAAMYVKEGVDPVVMLHALTINPARFLGLDQRVGSIEVGKDADMVIWSGDPFHYMTDAEVVVVNGKVVKNMKV